MMQNNDTTSSRTAEITRATAETDIRLTLSLDGTGKADIHTGIGFFDHMLDGFSRHGLFDLTVHAEGDLQVDSHHTIEDTGIVLGQAIREALGDRKGIRRFGSAYVPMDEALAFTALDFSNRPYLVFDAEMPQERIGEYDSCLTLEFMRAVAHNAGITLHQKCFYGVNAHHITEGLFKSFGLAVKDAVKIEGTGVTSTKGVL